MKNFKKLLAGYTYMTDGVQDFDGCVVTAMDGIQLWDVLMASYKISHDGINYFISIGENGRYFKTDGQRYTTHIHIQKGEDCYLETCYCSWTQSEFDKHVEQMKARVEKFISEGFDFETKFKNAVKDYPWQTSKR